MFTKLKYIRTSKKVTCGQLADLLGFKTRGAYYKKEIGSVPFYLNEAKLIADYFGDSIENIFFED